MIDRRCLLSFICEVLGTFLKQKDLVVLLRSKDCTQIEIKFHIHKICLCHIDIEIGELAYGASEIEICLSESIEV